MVLLAPNQGHPFTWGGNTILTSVDLDFVSSIAKQNTGLWGRFIYILTMKGCEWQFFHLFFGNSCQEDKMGKLNEN